MRRLPVVALAVVVSLLAAPAPGSAGSLQEDGRAGIVTDLQGVALVRPVGRERWTPLDARAVVFPGDVIRTEARGAHALEVRLTSGARLVLGPATYVELPNEGGVRLLRGELEARGADAAPVHVTGPGDFAKDVAATVWLRATDRETKDLGAEPRWLTGYRSSTSEEWMGSLVATVSGKAVPLSVGFHKVTVEIRDQLARTTVEESFVNTTHDVLEGVFSFPLPADASISGFGMWIGSELVEADVVEKQRARAIYEDILRRKKDPGLLEWEGGNLFKARVYPIAPLGEKRIRLRYTQVLPMAGDSVRYRYALRSELLRLHPLRELAISVNVTSAAAIRDVSRPTHPVVLRKTDHEAVVEFGATSYVPDRDFEVAVTVERPPPLSALAHRRGDDGFFLLFLSPEDPAGAGGARGLVPDGRPLDLILVADTSGSMDPPSRTAQAAFVSALLAQCSPKDRFRLLACDVEPHWLVQEAQEATEENAAKALAALDARFSLGWTDLEKAFDAVAAGAAAGTDVVYVGDGIPTSGKADPVATADALRARAKDAGATFHAVSVSASYEKGVLEAIASVGGGSVRRADDDPASAANALLREIARPGLKDLKVSVTGLPTARVYPETLPNLPLGEQQIVLGRFLPGGDSKTANVVVTGTLAGKPVRYESSFAVPAPEEGNSFLPRLWARRHLDALMAEGASAKTREEIVAFSREYQIMTPYTSFLVLENDEDRARYGVERTVHMRDAERFFAEARDQARLEIARKQAQTAHRWNAGLRRRMRREIEALGRDLPTEVAYGQVTDRLPPFLSANGQAITGLVSYLPGYDVEMAQQADVRGPEGRVPAFLATETYVTPSNYTPPTTPAAAAAAPPSPEEAPSPEEPALFGGEGADEGGPSEETGEPEADPDDAATTPGVRSFASTLSEGYASPGRDSDFRARTENLFESQACCPFPPRPSFGPGTLGFPSLGSPPKTPREVKPPAWDPVVLKALAALDRRPALAALPGALRVQAAVERLHPTRGTVVSRSRATALLSARRWLATSEGVEEPASEAWLSETERGVLDATTRLGRVRPAADADRGRWPLPVSDLSLVDAVRELTLAYRRAPTATQEGNVIRIVFRGDDDPAAEMRLLVDTGWSALLERRRVVDGRTTSVVTYSEFVAVAGRNWPTKVETADEDGHVVARQTLAYAAMDAAAFDAALDAAAKARGDALLIPAEDRDLVFARQAVHDGKATLADRLAIACGYAARERWDAAWKAWEEVEGAAGGKPGVQWMRLALLSASRRGVEWGARAAEMARAIAAAGGKYAAWQAWRLDAATTGLGAKERLAILDAMSAAWQGPGPDADLWALHARRRHAEAQEQAGNGREARAERAALAKDRPFDLAAVLARAWDLAYAEDDVEASAAYLGERALKGGPWSGEEATTLFSRWVGDLWQLKDLPGLEAAVTAWIAAVPIDGYAPGWRFALPWYRGRYAEGSRAVVEALSAPLPEEGDRAGKALQDAAVRTALGDGQNLWMRSIPLEWRGPLADLARRGARSEVRDGGPAGAILGDWRFRQTEEGRRLREELTTAVSAEGTIASLSLRRLTLHVQRLEWGAGEMDDATWRRVVDALLARWRATSDPADAEIVSGLVRRVFGARERTADLLSFLRERVSRAGDRDAPRAASDLLEALLAAPFATALEDEALALLPRLVDPLDDDDATGLRAATAVRRLATWSHEGRRVAALGTPEERAALTRAQAAERTREAKRKASEGVAARLATAVAASADPFRPWLEIERSAYSAESGGDLARVETDARALLATLPPAPTPVEGQAPLAPWKMLLARRASILLAYAATRRAAPEGLADRVLAVLVERAAADDRLLDARYEVFRLLVALDRADELDKDLASWIREDDVTLSWRVALAYLRAETGRVKEAAEAMEAAAAIGDLAPADWAALADWYLVLGDDAKRAQAAAKRWDAMDEWALQRVLWAEESRVGGGGEGVPADLDPEVLGALRAYLSKTSTPQDAIRRAQSLYVRTKDFRVLESLADGILGHSPETAYAYLSDADSIVVEQIHEEATCDALVARIEALLARPTNAVDGRALRLLLCAVESRAAAVPKADPKHGERAVAALEAALAGDVVAGERVLLAQAIEGLGAPQDAALAAREASAVEALVAGAGDDPRERLAIGTHLARLLWKQGRKDDATDRLESLLAAALAKDAGALDPEADGARTTLVDWWTEMGRFRKAEARLREDVVGEARSGRRESLRQRLFRLYVAALERGGETSLGAGADLFRAAGAEIERYLADGPAWTLADGVGIHGEVFSAAAKPPLSHPAAAPDYARFVRERLPALLARVPYEATEDLHVALGRLAGLGRPADALAGVVERIEGEPREAESLEGGAWSRMVDDMAEWRRNAGGLGPLEPRLLTVVLSRLERGLASMDEGNGSFWRSSLRTFWSEHAADFAAVAARVAEAHASEPAIALHVANYQRDGLGLRPAAISTLAMVVGTGKAPEDVRATLATWLVEDGRHGEALPLLERLVAERADRLDYRTLAARALHGLARDPDALRALSDAASAWKERKAWTVDAASTLASTALDAGFAKEAAEWIEDAIRMRREGGGSAGPDGTLAAWYAILARARSLLGDTDAAVRAAAAAVVAWGPDADNRQVALEALREVIAGAKDLDAWTARYEAEAASSGLDAPTIRKAIGQVLLSRRDPTRAAAHLRIARDLDPADPETHDLLVQALDGANDAQGAIEALLVSVRVAPKNLPAYADLASRFARRKDPEDAERARTSLVEAMPSEPDGYRSLAGIREKNGRWALAVEAREGVVRVRPNEPDGWFSLANAQVKSGDVAGAKAPLKHLLHTTWENDIRDSHAEAARRLAELK